MYLVSPRLSDYLCLALLVVCVPALPCSLPALYWIYKYQRLRHTRHLDTAWQYERWTYRVLSWGLIFLCVLLFIFMLSMLILDALGFLSPAHTDTALEVDLGKKNATHARDRGHMLAFLGPQVLKVDPLLPKNVNGMKKGPRNKLNDYFKPKKAAS